MKSGRDVAGSIVINRWHDNVAFLFGESGALDASKDQRRIHPRPHRLLPELLLRRPGRGPAGLLRPPRALTRKARGTPGGCPRYGVNRAEERLWDAYDWFQARFLEDEPVDGGLFDLNRYYYLAQ